MGATGQPAGKNERRGGGSRAWWEDYRATLFAVCLALAGVGTAAMGVVGREAQIVLLWVSTGLVLLGLAALIRPRTYLGWFRAVARWVGRRWMVVVPLALVVAGGTVFGILWLQGERSCDDPTEVAVMVPEEGAAGFSAAADAFERDSATRFSCPQYHVTTFGVGWPELRAAMASGWRDASGEEGTVSLDLGPRPDVWIAESSAQADLVANEGAGQGFVFAGSKVVAGSPLVLAVPEPHADALLATTESGDTVRELVASARAAGLDVVRANPDASFAAALHTADLYAGSGAGATSDADAEALELSLGHALERVGLPVGTDSALLCRLDEVSRDAVPAVAVLTTERAMVDPSAGCPASDAGVGDVDLVPFYPGSTPGLDYTAVRLDWAGEKPERRAAAASAFVGWLTTTEGQTALDSEVRVRGLGGSPPSGADGPLPGLQDAPTAEPGTGRVPYARVMAAERLYHEARRPARVLVLVDASTSMRRPADGDRLRIEVAERGVLGALGHLSGSDEVGIWSFSGSAGSSPRTVLDMTTSEAARNEAPERLGDLRPNGYTPLYDAVDAGTSHLIGLDADGVGRRHLTAVVVLTDGENRPGDGPGADLAAADLVRSAQAEAATGVRVYVVAVGEASCQVSDLQEIAAEWDGECWDSSFGELESTLGSLFGQLGGR